MLLPLSHILTIAIFNKLLPVIASDVKTSNGKLLFGVFLQAFKTAFFKPLIKINNLFKMMMENYRAVSNLQFNNLKDDNDEIRY